MRALRWYFSWSAFAALLALSAAWLPGSPEAEAFPVVPTKAGLVHFDAHLKHVQEAKHEHYKNLPGVKVAHAQAFNEMKAHLQTLYKNVKVQHTFIGHDGHHVDVVAVDKQPGLQHPLLKNHKVQLTPPALLGMPKAVNGKALPTTVQHLAPHLVKGMKDKHGHDMYSPPGTIPLRRVTLAELTKFPTLRDYHQKQGAQAPRPTANLGTSKPEQRDSSGFTHRYAATRQVVANFGGSSWLNLWSPTPASQEFSLSQHWYTGGNQNQSAAESINRNALPWTKEFFMGGDPFQTVEGGWQVYPAKYGHNKPVLFVYWTADNYNKTGAYNLEGGGFVQVNHSYVIGGAWNQSSQAGGAQVGIKMTWYRDPGTGNWWLYLQGGGQQTAVGYYPRELFGKGQMSKFATSIGYGGEVTGRPLWYLPGAITTGMMGSGAPAAKGWQHAAFQKDIYYFPTRGSSAWANLTGFADTNRSYSIDVHNQPSNWGTYFFFGGPGGRF